MHFRILRAGLIVATLVALLSANAAQAQDLYDYLRFSETNTAGTARGLAMGGAMTAVGADFSSATLNPAGLAMFRRSELTLTPSLRIANSMSEFIGTDASNSRTNFGFGQIGLVIANPIYRARDLGATNTKGLKSYAIGVGFNQQNNFWRKTSGNAFNPFNSIGDAMAGLAAGSSINGLDAYTFAAYRAYVIDTVYNPNAPAGQRRLDNHWLPTTDVGQMQQTFTITERGRTNQWTIAGALNFGDEFYLGLGVGIMDHDFRSEVVYDEFDSENVYSSPSRDTTVWGYPSTRSLTFSDVTTITGTGINARLGLLWQPLDFFRIGASIQTPTYSTLTLSYGPEFYTVDQVGTRSPQDGNLQAGTFDFDVITPWRTNLGVTFLIAKKGMISADVEYVDYASGSFRAGSSTSNEYFTRLNQTIGDIMTSAVNYRIGAEYRPINKVFVRAGYAVNQTPLNSAGQEWGDLSTYNSLTGDFQTRVTDRVRTSYSGGLGYRPGGWFVELAVVYTNQSDASLVHPTYVTPQSLRLIEDNGSQSVVPFSDGINQGGLGAGFQPWVVSEIKTINVFLTVGFTLGRR